MTIPAAMTAVAAGTVTTTSIAPPGITTPNTAMIPITLAAKRSDAVVITAGTIIAIALPPHQPQTQH